MDITTVLVGRKGSGKSATGNSILGRKEFESKSSFTGETTVCKRGTTVLPDGQTLNVIDTPGLFDASVKAEVVQKEIVRCMEMAKDGIDAVLMVVSLKVRFSDEQVAVIETLKYLFGAKIFDHMIVVFTGADELEDGDELDEHLTDDTCPKALMDLLEKCENRRVAFDNKTKDKGKKAEQRRQLLTLIRNLTVKNGRMPYTADLFLQLQKKTAERDSKNSKQQKSYDDEQMQQRIGAIKETAERDSKNSKQQKSYDDEQMQQRIGAIVEKKLKEKNEETIYKLKQDIERVQREENQHIKAEEEARNEINRLKEQLEKAKCKDPWRLKCSMM